MAGEARRAFDGDDTGEADDVVADVIDNADAAVDDAVDLETTKCETQFVRKRNFYFYFHPVVVAVVCIVVVVVDIVVVVVDVVDVDNGAAKPADASNDEANAEPKL